ncbi:hypothetical protein [Kitasatospora viridis]|uniref:hypothetical protein n=1 Tax=Kitasatospora viridis TaxID=281105 RepID=UPI0011A6E222|nr:hypothetical protein [Kitasatospora viridis]
MPESVRDLRRERAALSGSVKGRPFPLCDRGLARLGGGFLGRWLGSFKVAMSGALLGHRYRGPVDDVAASAVLASPATSFVVGRSLHVDGGWTPN